MWLYQLELPRGAQIKYYFWECFWGCFLMRWAFESVDSVNHPLQHGWLRWYLSWWRICCNAGDLGSIPGLGKSPGEGRDCLLQYSGLENSMDCIVHGVAKSWARLRNFRFHSRECHKSIKTHGCIQSVEGLDRTGSKGRRSLYPSSASLLERDSSSPLPLPLDWD